MQSQALVPPVRPSQMAISAGIPHLPHASNLAKLIGAPPKVKGSPPPMTVFSKPPPIQKGTDSQLNPQGQAEEVEEPGSVLASAVLDQSRALTSLVSHLQQGGDPLLGGQADSSGQSLSSKGMAQREKLQQQLASRSGGFFLAVLQNALRKVKPAARVPCIDCGGGLDLRFQHDNLSGALRRLRCIQRTGLDPVCHCSCVRCCYGKRYGWSEGVGESPYGRGRTGGDGRRADGFCIQDDVVGRAAKSTMELPPSRLRPSVQGFLAAGSSAVGHVCLGVLERNRLYSIEAPGDCCQEGCSPSARSGVAQSEEEEISKGWPKTKGGGQGNLDTASRDCRAGDGPLEELTEDAECLADPLPPESLKEEDPCQFDRWCSESGRFPGDKGNAKESGRGGDPGLVDEEWTKLSPRTGCNFAIKSEFDASSNPLKPIPFPSWVEKFVGQVIAAKTRFSFFVKSSIRCCRSGRLSSTATALFPIPFADVAIWTGPRGLSKEKRIRLAELKILHLVICGLNYEYFRQPFSVLGLLRRRPSQRHVEVFSRLLSHIRACGHSDMVLLDVVGRVFN